MNTRITRPLGMGMYPVTLRRIQETLLYRLHSPEIFQQQNLSQPYLILLADNRDACRIRTGRRI